MSNKEKRVLQYMEEFGSITSLEAFTELGDTRLAATIHELKRQGYHIGKTSESSNNRFGEKRTYAKYFLVD